MVLKVGKSEMNKQEEIQSYMRGWLKYAQGTHDDGGIDYALKQMTWGLDSQGVVIRVERELPKDPTKTGRVFVA